MYVYPALSHHTFVLLSRFIKVFRKSDLIYIMSAVADGPTAAEIEDDNYFDDLEAELLGEERNGIGGRMKGNVGDFTDKINLTARVQNDIARSERKGDKKSSHYGRDDRATSEQVMDPRTRLILFKLLNSGYLTEIDGDFMFWVISSIAR